MLFNLGLPIYLVYHCSPIPIHRDWASFLIEYQTFLGNSNFFAVTRKFFGKNVLNNIFSHN